MEDSSAQENGNEKHLAVLGLKRSEVRNEDACLIENNVMLRFWMSIKRLNVFFNHFQHAVQLHSDGIHQS